MNRPYALRDFAGLALANGDAPAAREEVARQEGFEAGYAAGWEDSSAARHTDEVRLADEVSQNLQALSFTHTEARSHVLRGLEPLLHEMVAKVLPAVAQASLGGIVRQTLLPLADEMASAPVTIRINPSARTAVEAALSGAGFPVVITDEPSLGPGQVWLRLGDVARSVDLDGMIDAIRGTLSDFLSTQAKVLKHG